MSISHLFRSLDDYRQLVDRLPADGGDTAALWRAQCYATRVAVVDLEDRSIILHKSPNLTKSGVRAELAREAEKAALPAVAKLAASLKVIDRQRETVLAQIAAPAPDPSPAGVQVRAEVRAYLRAASLGDRVAAVLRAADEGGVVAEAVEESPVFLLGLGDDVIEKFHDGRQLQALLRHPEVARRLGILDEGEAVLQAVRAGALTLLADMGAVEKTVVREAAAAVGPEPTIL
jgi:hypothetical protein